MCGIVGGVGLDIHDVEVAVRALRHRGPDAQAVWQDAARGVVLGHTRLSVIDPDASAHQPMICPRTGNAIVFNGEIYNFSDLRRELEPRGWLFRTRSDTEVLLAAYSEWGPECLAKLHGMFAFAVYDVAAGHILLARDRVGKKPLYVHHRGGRLAFASELKGLWAAHPGLERHADPGGLAAYLELGYVPASLSIASGVSKLPPASWATYDLQSGLMSEARYWRLPEPRAHVDPRQALDELDARVHAAVRERLRSDVPLGVFLSGGVDSTLVTAVAKRYQPDLVAYTVGFPGARTDETPHARRVADALGVELEVLPVVATGGRLLPDLAWYADEPLGDSSLLPTAQLCEAVRRDITVALSGDGGDELFAGYDAYLQPFQETLPRRVPRNLRGLGAALGDRLPLGLPGRNFLRRLRHEGAGLFIEVGREPEGLPQHPLAPGVLDATLGGSGRRLLRTILDDERGVGALTTLQEMTRLDFRSYLPDDLLAKVDRASMRVGLEVRCPLLDHRVVEFAYGLPDHLRVAGGVRKVLLKQLLRRYLPDQSFERKQGFSVPEAQWMRGAWGDQLEAAAATSRLLDPAAVGRLVAGNRRHGRLGQYLFRTLMLALFEQQWLAPGSETPWTRN